MIFIGLGANLPSVYGAPKATLTAALTLLAEAGIGIEARSRWYKSPAVPPSDQPWFTNGVAAIATRLPPAELLALLKDFEARLGRRRSKVLNEARPIDLDLLAYHDLVQAGDPILPHPRLHERAFVLLPLAEIAPEWRHPRLGLPIKALIAALPPGAVAEPLTG